MSQQDNPLTKPTESAAGSAGQVGEVGQLTPAGQSSLTHAKKADDPHSKQAFLVVLSELCFVALPFVVYAFVLGYLGRITKIFTLSEWAFAAVLLLGQSLSRFFTLLMSGRKPRITGKPLIIFVFVLVFGLIPSVIVLLFTLLGGETGSDVQPPPTTWFPTTLNAVQVGFFAVAIVIYFVLVGAYEYESARGGHQPNDPPKLPEKS